MTLILGPSARERGDSNDRDRMNATLGLPSSPSLPQVPARTTLYPTSLQHRQPQPAIAPACQMRHFAPARKAPGRAHCLLGTASLPFPPQNTKGARVSRH